MLGLYSLLVQRLYTTVLTRKFYVTKCSNKSFFYDDKTTTTKTSQAIIIIMILKLQLFNFVLKEEIKLLLRYGKLVRFAIFL